MKKINIVAASIAALGLIGLTGAGAAQAYDVASTTWDTAGMKQVVAETGAYSWSVDGLGTIDGSGNIQVNKPATATSVYKAYFMAAQVWDPAAITLGSASPVLLNGSAVSFELASLDARGFPVGDSDYYGFNNYFGDVTSLVSTTLNAASTGVSDISVDEGGLNIEGTALLVIWNDSSVDVASVIIAFGNSQSAGDNFALSFPALTTPQLEDLQFTIGSSYSYQEQNDSPGDATQSSNLTVNGLPLADTAGGFDDCFVTGQGSDPSLHWNCEDGGLLTVGGVGDSTTNPTLPTSDPIGDVPDDELYSLSPFVQVGSSEIAVQTRNASVNDNVFFAAFNLKHVVATLSLNDAALPDTGMTPQFGISLGLIAAGLGLAGAASIVMSRRKRA